MIYNSQAINTDPFPYVGEHGSRHAYAGTLNQKPLTFAPRPEYDNDPNPILVEFRNFCGPAEWNITPEQVPTYAASWVDLMDYEERDFTTWGSLWNSPDEAFNHARKVLIRLAALEGN